MKKLLLILCCCLLPACIPMMIGGGATWWCLKGNWPCTKSIEEQRMDCWESRACLYEGQTGLPMSSWSRDDLIAFERLCSEKGM